MKEVSFNKLHIGDYIYFARQDNLHIFLYIMKINNIIKEDKFIESNNIYMFSIPFDKSHKCNLYDTLKNLYIQKSDKIYKIKYTSFISTYNNFIKYNKYTAENIPFKIIVE